MNCIDRWPSESVRRRASHHLTRHNGRPTVLSGEFPLLMSRLGGLSAPSRYTYTSTYQLTPAAMDEDLIAFGVIMVFFLSVPFLLLLSITGCIAYRRTKAWDKSRNQAATGMEATRLVDGASDESELDDTDDESERAQRKAEARADNFLTFNQKFRKEFGKLWRGKGREAVVKEREREERRKLAKAVAKELDRRERRRARQAAKNQEVDELPPYKKA